MPVHSQNLGLRAPPPRLLGTGPADVYSMGKGESQRQKLPGTSQRAGRRRVLDREPGLGAAAGDPFLLILSPGISGFGTGRLSLGLGEAPKLSACPGPPAKRTRCSQVRWPPPCGTGRLPNRCLSSLSNLPAPHSPAVSPRPLPPL